MPDDDKPMRRKPSRFKTQQSAQDAGSSPPLDRGANPTGSRAASWIAAFINYVRSECHLSANTAAAYRRDLAKFAEWLAGRDPVRLSIRELADYRRLAEQAAAWPRRASRGISSR